MRELYKVYMIFVVQLSLKNSLKQLFTIIIFSPNV